MEFINLKAQYNTIKQQLDVRFNRILSSAQYIGGDEVSEFEDKLSDYVGRKYCISCGNGTDALQLIYMAYGIGPGHAVFCPAMTFIASVEPACMLGATPIFCDIDPETYNIDLDSLKEKIALVEKEGIYEPKAVIAVDFLGNPAKYQELSNICHQHNLILIEDAAQAMSARYHDRRCGSFADIAATSFFPSKPLGCYGDGGAVFTDDEDMASLIKSIKVHGKGKDKYNNVRIGINSRLDTLQAGVLLTKMEYLESELTVRQNVAAKYDEAFAGSVQTPIITENSISSYAQYVILADSSDQRELLIQELRKNDIPSLIYYPNPLHKLKVFSSKNNESYPNAERYAECNLGLPFSPYLTDLEQEKVIEAVSKVI